MVTEISVRIEGLDETISGDILLEGHPISQVAEAAREGPDTSFGYYDVLNFFSLTGDQYTPTHHNRLVAEMTSGARDRFSIRDSLPPEVRKRDLQQIGSLDPETIQSLGKQGFPLSLAGFELAIGNMAEGNLISPEQAALYAFEDFLRGTKFFWFNDCRNGLPFVLKDMLKISGQPLEREIAGVFHRWGCGEIEPNRACVDRQVISESSPSGTSFISGRGERYPFETDDSCPDYNHVIDCLCGGIEGAFDTSSRDQITIATSGLEGKNGSPVNTYTQTDRTLRAFEAMRKFAHLFPRNPKFILDIGAGYQSPKSGGPAEPREAPQSHEPFALVDFALSHLEADLRSLRVDLWDINPRVLDHFDRMKQGADPSSHTRLVFPDQWSVDWLGPDARYLTAISRLPGTTFSNRWWPDQEDKDEKFGTIVLKPDPTIPGHFHPQRNDVAADAGVEGTQYDIALMLYVFLYLDDRAKLLALDKVARHLAPGGVLVTDSRPGDLRPHGLELVADHPVGKRDNNLVIFRKR